MIVVGGRFELGPCIARGRRTSIYLARDRTLEREVSLKILEPDYAGDLDAADRVRAEAKIVAHLSHPNILRVFGRGVEAGREYVVFEYAGRWTLRKLLADRGRIKTRAALELAGGLAQGVVFAQKHGLVHHDVSTGSVLVSPQGIPKLTYWGFAPSEDATADRGSTTALAALLYELLTGSAPDGETPEPLGAVRPDVPVSLAFTVDRILGAGAAGAVPSASSFLATIEAQLAEAGAVEPAGAETMIKPPGDDRPAGLPPKPPATSRTRFLPVLLVGLGLALLFAVAAIALTRHTTSKAERTANALTVSLRQVLHRRSPGVTLGAVSCALNEAGTSGTCTAIVTTRATGAKRMYTIRIAVDAAGRISYRLTAATRIASSSPS